MGIIQKLCSIDVMRPAVIDSLLNVSVIEIMFKIYISPGIAQSNSNNINLSTIY